MEQSDHHNLNLNYITITSLLYLPQSSLDDSTGSGGADSNATTPSPSYSSSSASTWANWPDPPGMPAFPTARQDNTGSSGSGVGGQVAERPHTISSAYEKSHHSRPSLSAQMFEPPGYKGIYCVSIVHISDGRTF